MSQLEKLKAFYDGLSNKDTPIAIGALNLIKRWTPKPKKSAAKTRRPSPSKKGGKRKKTQKKHRRKNKTKSKK